MVDFSNFELRAYPPDVQMIAKHHSDIFVPGKLTAKDVGTSPTPYSTMLSAFVQNERDRGGAIGNTYCTSNAQLRLRTVRSWKHTHVCAKNQGSARAQTLRRVGNIHALVRNSSVETAHCYLTTAKTRKLSLRRLATSVL